MLGTSLDERNERWLGLLSGACLMINESRNLTSKSNGKHCWLSSEIRSISIKVNMEMQIRFWTRAGIVESISFTKSDEILTFWRKDTAPNKSMDRCSHASCGSILELDQRSDDVSNLTRFNWIRMWFNIESHHKLKLGKRNTWLLHPDPTWNMNSEWRKLLIPECLIKILYNTRRLLIKKSSSQY